MLRCLETPIEDWGSIIMATANQVRQRALHADIARVERASFTSTQAGTVLNDNLAPTQQRVTGAARPAAMPVRSAAVHAPPRSSVEDPEASERGSEARMSLGEVAL
eukprot:TRINITY_DN3482_c0_g1_i4.p1 TRINITY_DN3482_c0_g1~~TRINITY_DN3482_c0_g1_i4.p1  ORF type:complete len:106 (+),score=7.39 TRINITY_DN3482_c0_g1_i4:167-484(+)